MYAEYIDNEKTTISVEISWNLIILGQCLLIINLNIYIIYFLMYTFKCMNKIRSICVVA